jgi:hypothetical protein
MLWTKTSLQPLSSVRVFISSTFRDMAAERDVLARRIFPKLRRYSEEHGLPLSEIDLRWGITSEEAAEGKIIELCLHEIDSCRPYFFSMLGERYGLIDPHAAERLADRFPHLLPFADRSVTELEIRHGALGPQPAPRDRCFFYLRDPNYLDHLPEGADRNDFANESPLHRERLEALKREIRKSGFHVREYGDLNVFRDLIEQDLRSAIAPVVEAAKVGIDEAGQRGFVTAVSQAHVEQAGTRSFLDLSRGKRKPILLIGGQGTGKSASLAHWVNSPTISEPPKLSLWRRLLHIRSANASEPAVLCHFLQVEPDAEDWLPLAQGLLADLKLLLGRPDEIARTPENVMKQLRSWLAMAGTLRPLIVIIDGLERAYRRPSRPMLDWLPTPLPKGVDIVLSVRDGSLSEALAERRYATYTLPGFSRNEVETVVRSYLAVYGKRLSDKLLRAIAEAPQAATPLFACALAEELRQFGIHEQLQHFVSEYLACPDITGLFVRLLRRLDQDFRFGDDKAARDALVLIAASRGGLAESELLDLLGGNGEPMPPRPWAELRLAIKNLLVERQGLIDIGPSALRDALRLPREQDWRTVRLQLIERFAEREPGPRVVRELPWQLSLLQEWDRLGTTISEPKFLILGWKHCRRDFIAYWRELELRGHEVASAHALLLTLPLQNVEASRALAQLLVELGHYEIARPLAVALVAESGTNTQIRLDSLSLLAGIILDLGALDEALVVLGQLREEAKREANLAVLSVCLGNLALCANLLGNLAGALAYHAEEEACCRAGGDTIALGECLGNYAADLQTAGQPREALARWREQEEIARHWNQSVVLCKNLEAQARTQIELRKGKGALRLLAEAATLHREAGDMRGLRTCLNLTAEARASIGDVDGAYALYQEVEAGSLAAGDVEGVVDAQLAVARLFLAHGRDAAARHTIQLAAQAASALTDPARRLYLQRAIQTVADRLDKPSVT